MDNVWQQLPRELMMETLSHAMVEDVPCALQLFVPEWNLCSGGHCQHDPYARFDSFTVAANHVSQVSTTFGHGPCDHVFFPMIKNLSGRPRFSQSVDRELVKTWTDRSLCVYGQQLHRPSAACTGMDGGFEGANMLNDSRAVSLLPYVDEPHCCAKEMLPSLSNGCGRGLQQPAFLYQRVRHLMLNTSLDMMALFEDSFVGGQSRSGPRTVRRAARRRLERERQAHLLVDFGRMDRLGTLFLDLRAASRDEIDYAVVLAAARNLAARAQGLELLVIAGLRSYAYFPGHAPLNVDEVNERFVGSWHPDAAGDDDADTWRLMSLFAASVRPGGRVVFVEKQNDYR